MALRFGLAQINAIVGDMRANAESVTRMLRLSKQQGVDFVVFPELCLCGYPPEDLLHKPKFAVDNDDCLEVFLPQTEDVTAIMGLAHAHAGHCYNAAAIVTDGKLEAIYQKGQLPNYGVFDEKRYFSPGHIPVIFEQSGIRIAVTICEDIWDLKWLDTFLNGQKDSLDLIVNLSASPFHAGKVSQRQKVLADCARHFNCAVAYCNLVGGQDELVFDGRSMMVDASGKVITQAKEFAEDICVVDLEKEGGRLNITPVSESYALEQYDEAFEVYQALVLGTRDYVRKNGFSKVAIGLSGGIDSALVAAVAAEALGKENVVGVTMPSRFNTAETRGDAEKLAENLGIEFHTVPIADTLEAFSKTLETLDGWDENGLAYENLQARIRGTMMMSYSNQFGWLVLTTGNKSETAVGYCTLYGDTAGGFAVIKDVPKTLVYRICGFINQQAGREIIPETTITRPPSAELRPDQKDSDSLPDYDLLDAILKNYVELDHSAASMIEGGFPEDEVRRVIRLVDRNEYKRRQSPPGIKITPRAFGKDRRMPITNRYTP